MEIIKHSKVSDPTILIWWQWQRGHTRSHLEHGRPDYKFWSLASMVTIRLAIWESRTPPDYSSKSPDHYYNGQGFLRFYLG